MTTHPTPEQSQAHIDGWQDMATAPIDERFLAAVDGEVRLVQFGKTSHVPIFGWCLADQGPEDFDICFPTYWQPLPKPLPTPPSITPEESRP